jgi:hypothetical protein
MESELAIKETRLQGKAMDNLERFLDIENIDGIDAETLQFLSAKARIGIQIFREVNIGKRATENNTIRIYKEISLDKEQFKRLISKALPKYFR